MGKVNAVSTADEQEIAEARGSTVPDMLYDVAARAATSSIGQFVYKRIDNLLWTAEKTARWSLPHQPPLSAPEKTPTSDTATAGTEDSEDVGTNISGPPLIRPLPWLLFLPALIMLRVIRTMLSMGGRMVGRGPVLPATVVGFLQNKRRKLRALKYRGQRLQRIAGLERTTDGEPRQGGAAASWLQRIILPLKMVICTGPYRRVADPNSDMAHAVVFRKDRSTQKRTAVVSKKRNLNQREAESADEDEASDEESFEDAGCKELLEKYAQDAGDSSFNVEDISSASDDSASSPSDEDPSPKKPNLATEKQPNGGEAPPQQQQQQQPAQPASAKPANLKRSASEHKNGIDASQPASKSSTAGKSISTSNRSKSAAELEKGNNAQPAEASTGAPDGTGSASNNTTTPSKSVSNVTSSPENNENKPINHNNIPTGAANATAPLKSPSPAVMKAVAKQSPTMSDVRSNFQQQKQASAAPNKSGAPQQQQHHQQQQQQQQQQQPHQQPQHVSNGGKSRSKKPSTQSAA